MSRRCDKEKTALLVQMQARGCEVNAIRATDTAEELEALAARYREQAQADRAKAKELRAHIAGGGADG